MLQGVSNRTVCPKCCTERHPATTPRGAAAAAAKLDSLDFALGLYKLEDLEMMWERRWDTVALVGWGPGRIVVVFRGTTTLKNVYADLQACELCILCQGLSSEEQFLFMRSVDCTLVKLILEVDTSAG